MPGPFPSFPAQGLSTFGPPTSQVTCHLSMMEEVEENEIKGILKCIKGAEHPHFFGYQLWIPFSEEKSNSLLSFSKTCFLCLPQRFFFTPGETELGPV